MRLFDLRGCLKDLAICLARFLLTVVSAARSDFLVFLLAILSCPFHITDREIAVAVVRFCRHHPLFLLLVRCKKTGILVLVTVVLTLIGILVVAVADSRFLCRVIDVEIQICKVPAARTGVRCSFRKRIVPVVARSPCIPCSVEAVRNCCIADPVHRSNLVDRLVAVADKTGHRWALGIAAVVSFHYHIRDFFVQPSVVDFAIAGRIRRFGK